MVEEQDFVMYESADSSKYLIKIKIPKECCGTKISIVRGNGTWADTFMSSCKHCDTYPKVWSNYHVKKIHIPIDMETSVEVIKTPITYGHNCTGCKQYSDYAAPNQDDGTFKCYSCRHPMF